MTMFLASLHTMQERLSLFLYKELYLGKQYYMVRSHFMAWGDYPYYPYNICFTLTRVNSNFSLEVWHVFLLNRRVCKWDCKYTFKLLMD